VSTPEILNYQSGRKLDTVPGYPVGLQLRSDDTGKVYLTTSSTEFVLYFESDLAMHYDLEARLVKIAEPNQYWRRGLSNRIVHSRKRSRQDGGGLERTVLETDQADAVIVQAQVATATVADSLAAGRAAIEFGKPDVDAALDRIRPLLERAAAFDAEAARRDGGRFRSIYRSVAVLPPNEYNALVLQGTEGCTYNRCTFCELYTDVKFRARDADEFDEHIRAAIAYHGEAARSRRSIFLGEANALTLPHDHVRQQLAAIQRHFILPDPQTTRVSAGWWLGHAKRFEGVASFIDVFTGSGRSAAGWDDLRSLGLRRVHIGMESGSDELLAWLNKPASGEAIRERVIPMKEAGLNVSLIVLLGAGGHEYAARHVRDTARVINSLPLGRGDYVYLSPLIVYHGGPYDQRALSDAIDPLTADEIDQQEQALREAVRIDRLPGKPYVARYDLETFVY
jgi:hypothetical protein